MKERTQAQHIAIEESLKQNKKSKKKSKIILFHIIHNTFGISLSKKQNRIAKNTSRNSNSKPREKTFFHSKSLPTKMQQ